MARSIVRTILAGVIAALAMTSIAGADDTDLITPTPPNLLIILDSSQSMSWYDKFGNDVGNEKAAFAGTSASRILAAKTVIDDFVTRYADQINFGLASYVQDDRFDEQLGRHTNVTVWGLPDDPGGGSLWSYYYSLGWAAFPFPMFGSDPTHLVIGDRFYLRPTHFNLYQPQAGLGGPADPADPNGYNAATFRPNNTFFRVQWRLRPNVSPNPLREFWAGQPYIPPTTHPEDRCRYQHQRSDDGGSTWYFWGGTWDSSPAGCPPVGPLGSPWSIGAVTVDKVCEYGYRKSYDDPKPHVYNCVRRYNGVPSQTFTEDFQDLHVPHPHYEETESFTPGYMLRDYSHHLVTITVVENQGQPYRPDQYRWTYYYDATCSVPAADSPSNCANNGSFWQWNWSTPWYTADPPCNTAQVTGDPWIGPLPAPGCITPYLNESGQYIWTPSSSGYWGGLPFVQEYRWEGNNYKLIADQSCADPDDAAEILVDVGSGTLADIKNFLGTGTKPEKELRGANRSTPLGGTMSAVLSYFRDDVHIQGDLSKNCRGQYAILITDGGESCPVALTTAGDKAAQLLALTSLGRPPGGVKTFVVGIDRGDLSNDERLVLNDIAERGGTARPPAAWGNPPRKYYPAGSRDELRDALRDILSEVLSDRYTFTAPVLPRTRFADNLMAVQGSFFIRPRDPQTGRVPSFWEGTVKAYKLLEGGTLAQTPTMHIDVSAGKSEVLWDAATQLGNQTSRTMKIGLDSSLGGGAVDFVAGNNTVRRAVGCFQPIAGPLPPLPPINPEFPDVDGNGQIDAADCDALINLLKGDAALRSQFNWPGKMGDVFHFEPVLVGSPSRSFIHRPPDPVTGEPGPPVTSYADFRTAIQNQPGLVRLALVGANGGFLHAINAGNWVAGDSQFDFGTGDEVWAYSPPNFFNASSGRSSLTNLGDRTASHVYYVDGAAAVADVFIGNAWHTVAVVNNRQGATGLFHLDITDRRDPKPIGTALGDASYPAVFATCGYSWSGAQIGRFRVKESGKIVEKWGAVFGDGMSLPDLTADPDCGKKFYVIDLQTGKPLWVLSRSTDPASPLFNMRFDIAGTPILVDMNGDGFADRIYIGDTGDKLAGQPGQIWRFDVSAVGTNQGGDVDSRTGRMVDNWVVSRLFEGTSTQGFFEKLVASIDPDGKLWVFGGSGDRFNPLSLDDPDNVPLAGRGTDGRLLGLKDTYPARVTPYREDRPADNLLDVTVANTFTPGLINGWFYKLEQGEKVFAPTEVFNRTVFFGTLKPLSAPQECRNSVARLYAMYYISGAGMTADSSFTFQTPTATRYFTLGGGAPTRAVISTLALGGAGTLHIGTSGQIVRLGPTDLAFNAPKNLRRVRWWRQN